MKQYRYHLGTGMVAQLVPYRTEQQESRPIVKPKDDNGIISWKLIKIFAVIAVIKTGQIMH